MKGVVDYTKEIEWTPTEGMPVSQDTLSVIAANTINPPDPDYHTAISIWNGKDVMFADMYGNVMWSNGRKATSTIRNVKPKEDWVRVSIDKVGQAYSEAVGYPSLDKARYVRSRTSDDVVGYFETHSRRFVRVGEEDTVE